MAKKRKVPETLRRVFQGRARTLVHTIISLITQSPPSSFSAQQNPISFLLRPDDPSDYRTLLNHCFVVVNDHAPPLLDFSPVKRWSQQQIVTRTIEMIMCEQPISANVICSGFDKGKQSSHVLELLTCPPWDLLLQRVGDSVMVYILQHTSIFLPVSPKNHHQVTGPPMTGLIFKLPKHTANSQSQNPPYVKFGPQKKMKRVANVSSISETQQASSSASVTVNSSSIDCVGRNDRSYLRQFSEYSRCNCGQISSFGGVTLTTDAAVRNYKGKSNGELQQGSNQDAVNPRKRLRPFSWQRHRNQKQKCVQESSHRTPCTENFTYDDSLDRRFRYDSKNRMQEKCSCLLMIQPFHSQLVSKRDLIDRRPMFYSLDCSTVFPRNHILKSLKPNYADSQSLIRNIFGLSVENVSAESISCSDSSGFCLTGSSCLNGRVVLVIVSIKFDDADIP